MYITDSTSKREITSWAVPGAGLDVEKRKITEAMLRSHDDACRRIMLTRTWASHTVIVVDQSGSMRTTDVTGGATRSDALWLTLAVDYVSKQLLDGTVSSNDVVSVISMGRAGAVLIDRQPMDWVLFNRLIDLLRTQEPHFDGNYGPALQLAEQYLMMNASGSCAITLFFLSDGRPSDHRPPGGADLYSVLGSCVDNLSSRFGRRLTFVAVGFAGPDEDFRMLKHLASRPSKFGSIGIFHAASLTPESLGLAFSSLASSLTATKTELTDIGGASQRPVKDVRREATDTLDEGVLNTESWTLYSGRRLHDRYLWSRIDRDWVKAPMFSSDAVAAAIRKCYFGEGAERLVRKFREVDSAGKFVGPLLVAKEGRFESDVAWTDFHQIFCETQATAKELAEVFNARLAKIPGVTPRTPRIDFLECSVYEVNDSKWGTFGVLVEKQLDVSKYKKWNDNKGGVDGQVSLAKITEGLGAIEEQDDEEDEDEEEVVDTKAPIVINDADIPQAFSHFTYRYTNRKKLVCDLQGVLTKNPDGSRTFELTDPVIHYSSTTGRKNVFGRTDRGKSGSKDFFVSHKCGELCRMLNRKWVRDTLPQPTGISGMMAALKLSS